MRKYIKYIDSTTGKSLAASIGPDFTPEQAATAMGLAAGAWEEITQAEATELMLPTPEELAEARRAEILARLAEIDAASVRPLRAIANGDGTDYDTQKLSSLDTEAAGLRAELAEIGLST